MIKYLLSVFIFLQFFMINIHAQDTSKENDFYKQKYYEEKFIILNRDIIAKELEIKELKDELKSLENSVIKKDEVEKDLDKQNNRIEDINADVDKLSIVVTCFGILVTLIILIFAIKYEKIIRSTTKEETENEVERWLKKNIDKILEPVNKIADDTQASIEKEIVEMYQSELKRDGIHKDGLKKVFSEREEDILKKVVNLIDKKEEEQLTYDDWITKFFNIHEKNKVLALEYINNAINKAGNNYEHAKALFEKAYYLEKINLDDAVIVYKKIVDDYLTDKIKTESFGFQHLLLITVHNLGNIYSKTKEINESKKLYDLAIDLLIDINPINKSDILSDIALCRLELDLLTHGEMNNEKLKKVVFNSKKNHAIYEMLNLFVKLKVTDINPNELSSWMDTYKKDCLMEWRFDELLIWAETLNGEAKERVKKYIDIFDKELNLCN